MAAQDGFTLVELLLAATLMGLVLTASLAALTSVTRGQREVTSRSDELGQATVGTERLSREIRQARLVVSPLLTNASGTTPVSATTSTLQLNTRTLVGGVLKDTLVSYACSSGSLTRTVGGVTQTLVRNVVDDNVFTVRNTSGTTNYVAFSIKVNSRGKTVTLSDGVQLRNS
jgi:prepilin-type N-terminal cleavage/methylation domain-containing protein